VIRELKRLFTPNPLDVLLKEAKEKGHKKILIGWNRGLGDIALGLFALVYRIHEYLPQAKVTFLTRPDLEEGFLLLGNVSVLVSPAIQRGREFSVTEELQKLGCSTADFDLIIEKPDPTRWLYWQIGKLTPRLAWKNEWDSLHEKFALPIGALEAPVIGVHVQTETCYNYEKNWPATHWNHFFTQVTKKLNAHILLFGFQRQPVFEGPRIMDLRGKTNLLEMLSIIKNCCSHLVVPDSGVLSLAYYLDISTPLKVISLWADPRQGVLRQKVPSPNRLFHHVPMVGKNKDTSRIPVEEVLEALQRNEAICSPRKF
jgi:ADP-heptose:LPS heptosyltransferase